LSIGVLAVAATWLALGPLAAFNVQIWQIFIAWACFHHSGGKTEGAQKTVICMAMRSGRRWPRSFSAPHSAGCRSRSPAS
jgi:Protein of unknown function (DUF1097)